MVDIDPHAHPRRKPVPHPDSSNLQSSHQPLPALPPPPIPPQIMLAAEQPRFQTALGQPPSSLRKQSHMHSRTVSSSIFPSSSPAFALPPHQIQHSTALHHNIHSRQASNVSSPAASMATMAKPTPAPSMRPPSTKSSSNSVDLSRSISSRSSQSMQPTSYVALMRKQKATVWCDRSQPEDTRLLASQKAAKQRALMELSGGGLGTFGRTNTGGTAETRSLGVRGKIRSHGASKAAYAYMPSANANLVGNTGVPMRLSASEVGDEDDASDEDGDSARWGSRRTGSGRSSLASSQRPVASHGGRSSGRLSQGGTPPTVTMTGTHESEPLETPVQGDFIPRTESYFVPASHTATMTSTTATGLSGGSGSSGSSMGKKEVTFGCVGEMTAPSSAVATTGTAASKDELSRRGSVDERAATMRGAVRLFVANPDLSDDSD